MTEVERIECKKAYVELNEIIKRMPMAEKRKIPKEFRRNLYDEMDRNYSFKYDEKKDILKQNLKTETKALLVELYERFLAPKKERESWQKYDQICLKMLDEKKRENYNPNQVFINKNVEKANDSEEKMSLIVKKRNLFEKILEFLKHL